MKVNGESRKLMKSGVFERTRYSLLSRLKNWEDQKSWQEFYDQYRRLIFGVALRAGLSEEEAQEVLQETVITVAKNIGTFHKAPARGTFKSWLMHTTRWRIQDQLRKRKRSGIFINLNWYHAIQEHFKTMKDGGPYETPFIHADDVETSWSLALFPEFMDMKEVVDTEPRGYLPDGHIDKAGNLLHRAIAWYGQVGCGPMEIAAYQPGVVGKASKASADKAYPGVRALLDYMVKLHDDIKKTFPPGKLPPINEVTMRPKEEIEAVLKGPFAPGGRSIYSLHWPF